MAKRLTKGEIQLLKELKAAGEHGRRIAGTSSAEIAHLIGAHCVERLQGMKLYAADGAVDMQAQGSTLNLAALKGVTIASTSDSVRN